MSNKQTNINYSALVAAELAKACPKPSLEQVVHENLHHFAGFAAAGGNLGLACDWIASQTECNPDSLRRVFLLKVGKWSEFQGQNSKTVSRSDDSAAVSEIPSDDSGDTGFARVW